MKLHAKLTLSLLGGLLALHRGRRHAEGLHRRRAGHHPVGVGGRLALGRLLNLLP